MNYNYDCSFDFENEKTRKRYKFLLIKSGDLDVNNSMMLKGKNDVKKYLKERKNYDQDLSGVYAICQIKFIRFKK